MAHYYTQGLYNTPGTKNTVLCEKHQSENYPTKLDCNKDPLSDLHVKLNVYVKPSQVPTLPPRKGSIFKALAEVRDLLPDREKQNKRFSGFFIGSNISQF